MGILLSVVLPLSLAFIMFSLGVGLTFADFGRVLKAPRGFAVGALAQLVVLPITAFILLMLFPLSPELAVGVMILSFCPGGVTSNILTRLAGGELALSITLTAVISLVAVVTVPVLVGWSADWFMGTDAPPIDVRSLAFAMFLITAVPVLIGVTLRAAAPAFADRIEPGVFRVATVLFILIVIAALASNWAVFIENLPRLGPMLVVMNAALLILGMALARVAGLGREQAIAIAIETGVQNASLGITVGSLIVEASQGLPPFSLPSGVYGITMYFVALPYIWWVRRAAPMPAE